LGEFQLAVGPLVLVAEAAGDLVILFHAGDHEHLFELLRRLRLRAVSEAEAAKALVPATVTPATGTVAKEQKQKPGWFRRLFR
jgi:hypothetical protein